MLPNKVIYGMFAAMYIALMVWSYSSFGWAGVSLMLGLTVVSAVVLLALWGVGSLLFRFRYALLFRSMKAVDKPNGKTEFRGYFWLFGYTVLESFSTKAVTFIGDGFNMWSNKGYVELWSKNPERVVGFLNISRNENAVRFAKIMHRDITTRMYGSMVREWAVPRIAAGLIESEVNLNTWERRVDIAPPPLEPGVGFGDGTMTWNPSSV